MLITGQKQLDAQIKAFAAHDFITVDTEFLREKTYYPKLCLIQIGAPDKEAVAIDPLADHLDLTPVYDLLANEKVLKVFHAARQDLEIFFNLTGKVPTPIFDTQIAAMVCGYGDSVGYEALVRNITGHSLDKSAQYTDWSNRPLSDKQITYALGDVTYLVDLYEHLKAQLDKQGRTSWVYQEEEILSDPKTYSVDFQNLWQKIKIRSPKPKNLAVLRELAIWREEEAQKRNLPRPWVMRDETLADMASQIPQTLEAMKKIRGFSADQAKGKIGQALLVSIKTALAGDPKDWPQPKKKKPLPPTASATVDILRMLLKIQSAQHGVAAKLIASSEDLEQLAVKEAPDIPALKGWRAEIFGREAQALKKGLLSIGLKDNKIVKLHVGKDTKTYG
ncbi:MAG: ribonuclease D [Alphaproteobacteria bacterium]|nr:ribonuclease D [Alphaproteobacteria bacterium]